MRNDHRVSHVERCGYGAVERAPVQGFSRDECLRQIAVGVGEAGAISEVLRSFHCELRGLGFGCVCGAVR